MRLAVFVIALHSFAKGAFREVTSQEIEIWSFLSDDYTKATIQRLQQISTSLMVAVSKLSERHSAEYSHESLRLGIRDAISQADATFLHLPTKQNLTRVFEALDLLPPAVGFLEQNKVWFFFF